MASAIAAIAGDTVAMRESLTKGVEDERIGGAARIVLHAAF
jgi:hypothetical protein